MRNFEILTKILICISLLITSNLFAQNVDLKKIEQQIRHFKEHESIETLTLLMAKQVELEDEAQKIEEQNPGAKKGSAIAIKRDKIYKLIQLIDALFVGKNGYRKYAVNLSHRKNGWELVRLGFPGNFLVSTSPHLTMVDRLRFVDKNTSLASDGKLVQIKADLDSHEVNVLDAESEYHTTIEQLTRPRYKAVGISLHEMSEYGQLVLKNEFQKSGIDVDVMPVEHPFRKDRLKELLKGCKFVLITIPGDDYKSINSIIHFIRENSNAIIVAGGAIVTAAPIQMAAILPDVNIFLRGNDPQVFARVLTTLAEQRFEQALTPEIVKRVIAIYPKGSGGAILNFGHTLANISSDLVADAPVMFPPIDYPGDYRSFTVSSGCPQACRFCDKPGGNKLVITDADKFYEWITKRRKWLTEQSRLAIDEPMKVRLVDSNILANKSFINRLFELWEPDKFTLELHMISIASIMTKDNGVDEDVLSKLKRMGVTVLVFGLDALTDRTRRYFAKGSALFDVANAMERCRQLGFEVRFMAILTDPLISEGQYIQTYANFFSFLLEGFKTASINNFTGGGFGTPITNSYLVREAARIKAKNRIVKGYEGLIKIEISPNAPFNKGIRASFKLPNDQFYYPQEEPSYGYPFVMIQPYFYRGVKIEESIKYEPWDTMFWSDENDVLQRYIEYAAQHRLRSDLYAKDTVVTLIRELQHKLCEDATEKLESDIK